MRSNWRQISLNEIIELVIDHRGRTPKKLGGCWSDSGYRTLSAKNVKNGQIVQSDTIRFVDEDLYRKWMKEEIKRGDILITSEAPFGQLYYWDSDEKIVLGQRLFGLRIKDEYDARFIYYYMMTREFQEELKGRATGTTVIGLRQPELMKCSIRCPDITTQHRIASVFKTIDTKILINENINDNLAELLQTVYQERFGDVSAAAEKGILSDICSYSRDRVAVSGLNSKTYFSTENMLPEKAGATEATSLPTTPQTTACHKGDTLVSNIRPYFKKIVYCEDECGCSTDVLCFTPVQPKYASYLFSTLFADKFFAFMVAGSKGTKMPRGDKQQIMSYPVTLPSDDELDDFNALALPILAQLHSKKAENKSLEAARDALLPKLISGEIDVSTIQL